MTKYYWSIAAFTLFLAGCGESPRPGPTAAQTAPALNFTGEAPELVGMDPAGAKENIRFNVQKNGMAAFSVIGKHFEPRSVIVADGTKLLTAFGNPEWVSAEVPASLYQKAHVISVKVVNRDGKESNPGEFKIEAGK